MTIATGTQSRELPIICHWKSRSSLGRELAGEVFESGLRGPMPFSPLLPLLAIWLPPATFRLPVTFVAVLIALGLAGALRAGIGGSHVGPAVLRVVIGGPDE